jgi:hypothetical protein
MKKLIAVLLLSCISVLAEVPPFQTKTFEFVPPGISSQVILYKVYVVNLPALPGTTNFLFTTTSNRFTITNMLPVPQRVYVTSSNVWGESDFSVPYEMPSKPLPPTDIKPISTSIKTYIPGIIEVSTDLSKYNEAYYLSSVVDNEQTVTIKHQPNEPAKFFKSKRLSTGFLPPPFPY